MTQIMGLVIFLGFFVSFAQTQTFVIGAGGTQGKSIMVVDSSTPAEDFSGTSNTLTGKISFDADAQTGRGFVILDATTIDTGSSGRDKNMRSAKWMNFDEYPDIRLELESVTPTGKDSYDITGSLAMSGGVAPLEVAATVRILPESEETQAAGFTGDVMLVKTDFVVKLSDYAIDNTAYGSDSIANELGLSVTLLASNTSE